MYYKDVNNASPLVILNAICDKMNFSLLPPLSILLVWPCCTSLRNFILDAMLGLKDQPLAVFMNWESFLNYQPCMKCEKASRGVQISYDS